MALELAWAKGGGLRSRWWYGRFKGAGRRQKVNLGVLVRGEPPASQNLRDPGNNLFENSRGEAQAKLDQIREDAKRQQSSAELVQRFHELRTGHRIRSIPLVSSTDEDGQEHKGLIARWQGLTRQSANERYQQQCVAELQKLIDYIKAHHPSIHETGQIDAEVVNGYFSAVRASGVSPKTYNDKLGFFRSVFRQLGRAAGMAENPFLEMRKLKAQSTHKRPFTPDELQLVINAAKQDPFIGPIVIAGLTTAMRRGDCCLLTWKSVDLERREIAVKPAKGADRVTIPLFPLLEEELRKRIANQDSKGYVFAEQAMMFRTNSDGITYRVQKLLERVGFAGDEDEDDCGERGGLRQKTASGMRRVSIRGSHSFRTTWITLALLGGIPVEVVRKVTGHRTVEVVLTHYFAPQKEALRRAMEGKLPSLLLSGSATPKIAHDPVMELVTLAAELDRGNWKGTKRKLLQLAEKIRPHFHHRDSLPMAS